MILRCLVLIVSLFLVAPPVVGLAGWAEAWALDGQEEPADSPAGIQAAEVARAVHNGGVFIHPVLDSRLTAAAVRDELAGYDPAITLVALPAAAIRQRATSPAAYAETLYHDLGLSGREALILFTGTELAAAGARLSQDDLDRLVGEATPAFAQGPAKAVLFLAYRIDMTRPSFLGTYALWGLALLALVGFGLWLWSRQHPSAGNKGKGGFKGKRRKGGFKQFDNKASRIAHQHGHAPHPAGVRDAAAFETMMAHATEGTVSDFYSSSGAAAGGSFFSESSTSSDSGDAAGGSFWSADQS